MDNTPHFTITCDGGCHNNGMPNAHSYGSYHIKTKDGREALVRLDFGPGGTNNEAEYKALIEAMKDVVGRIEKAGRDVKDFTFIACTDSQLVVRQVLGEWSVNAPNLIPFRDEARGLAQRFASESKLIKLPRASIEAILGH